MVDEVLSLEDAKTFLKLEDADLDDPALLPAFIAAAVTRIENAGVGPLLSRPVTETPLVRVTSSRRASLVLNNIPVVSVTSIASTYDGSSIDVSTIELDSATGIVWIPYANLRRVSTGDARYSVTYVAGWATVPDDLILAVKLMVKHLAASYRVGKRRAGASVRATTAASTPDPRIPSEIAMLLEPYTLPGFA